MGRYYQLSKPVTKEQAEEILKETKALSDVRTAKVTDDSKHLLVETKDDDYVDVMNRVVNICRRIGGCDLSFYRFNVK